MGFFASIRDNFVSPPGGIGSTTLHAVPVWGDTSGQTLLDTPVTIDPDTGLMTVPELIVTTMISTGDNIIELNNDITGSPTEDAGILITRGTELDALLLWDETADEWVAGVDGSLERLIRSTEFTTHTSNSSIHFTEASIDHANILNIGTNSHAQIDSHITTGAAHFINMANPHGVTASQVGNTTAQWNADQIQSEDVNATTPTDAQALIYNGSNSEWEPQDLSGNAACVPYHIATELININSTTFLVVGGVQWLNSRYSGYAAGTIVYSLIAATNRDLELRVYDTIAATQLGIATITQGGGFTVGSFSITNPTSDTFLEVQVRKVTAGGNNGTFQSASLEFGS